MVITTYRKDWFNGRNYRVSLSDAIKHKEEHRINKIKYNIFEIKLTNVGGKVNFFIAETKKCLSFLFFKSFKVLS